MIWFHRNRSLVCFSHKIKSFSFKSSKSQSILVCEVNVFYFSGWTFIFPSKSPSVNPLPAMLVHLCEGRLKSGGSQAPYCRTSAAFGGGDGPGGHAVQVLVAPLPSLRRPHSSITMCSLSKLCSGAGLSHCWLATALATCFVALCKSVHTGTQARGGGILSSGAGIEKGGRPINESLP